VNDGPRTWKPYLLGVSLLCMGAFGLLVEGPLRNGRVWVDADAKRVAGVALAASGVWVIVSALRRR
jgi:hypothetical protein